MSISIKVGNRFLDLPKDLTITMEIPSPLNKGLDDFIPGGYSTTIDLPNTLNNKEIFNFPQIIQNANNKKISLEGIFLISGVPIYNCKIVSIENTEISIRVVIITHQGNTQEFFSKKLSNIKLPFIEVDEVYLFEWWTGINFGGTASVGDTFIIEINGIFKTITFDGKIDSTLQTFAEDCNSDVSLNIRCKTYKNKIQFRAVLKGNSQPCTIVDTTAGTGNFILGFNYNNQDPGDPTKPKGVVGHMNTTVLNPGEYYDNTIYTFFPIRNKIFFAEKTASGSTFEYINGCKYEPSYGGFTFASILGSDFTMVPQLFALNLFIECFKNAGYFDLQGTILNDEEIKNLVLLNLKTNDSIFSTNISLPNDTFDLSKCLPDVLIKDFIIHIRDLFGLGIFYSNKSKTIEFKYIKEVLEELNFIDWSGKESYPFEQNLNESNGKYSISYISDSSDDILSSRIKPVEGYIISTPVSTYSALPSSGALENEIRLVLDENVYYLVVQPILPSTVQTWIYHSINIINQPNSEGGVDVEINAFPLINDFPKSSGFNKWKTPICRIEGINSFTAASTFPLRTTFYRGFHPCDEYPSGVQFYYPLASFDNLDYFGNIIGNYSLEINGENGIYEKFLITQINWESNRKVIRRNLKLNPYDLQSLDFSKKYKLNNLILILKSIRYEVSNFGIGLVEAEFWTI